MGKNISFKTALPAALLLASVWLVDKAPAAEPTVEGLWARLDASGKPDGWFRISQRNGVYEGQLIKVFAKPGEDPASWRCTKCEGDRKDAPVVGITLIREMKRNGLAYEDGNILDPRDGSVYNARMELSPDGKQLSVRGYLGISLLGRTEVWTRLPEKALDADKNVGQAHRAGDRPATRSR